MKNLSQLSVKLSTDLIPFMDFKRNKKPGIYYFIDYWGIGANIEYNTKNKYHNFYYPFINGKHVSFLNDLTFSNMIYLIEKDQFTKFAESIIFKTQNIPIGKHCIFKFQYNGKLYFETGQIQPDTEQEQIILLDHRKAVLKKENILGWHLYASFLTKIKREFKVKI